MSDNVEPISDLLTQSLTVLFTEAYAGPPDLSSTWVTTNEPNSAILGTIEGLSAAQASAPVGEKGFSVAAHTEHLRWSLALVRAQIRGEVERADWEESWSVRTVDEEAWQKLRAELRTEFEALRPIFEAGTDWTQPYVLTGSIAVIAHATYHLGAIKQISHTAKAERTT